MQAIYEFEVYSSYALQPLFRKTCWKMIPAMANNLENLPTKNWGSKKSFESHIKRVNNLSQLSNADLLPSNLINRDENLSDPSSIHYLIHHVEDWTPIMILPANNKVLSAKTISLDECWFGKDVADPKIRLWEL